MGKIIQLRNVPEELHRKLNVRAAAAGMSLADYLLNEIRKIAERPTVEERLDRINRRTAPRLRQSPAQILHAERNRR